MISSRWQGRALDAASALLPAAILILAPFNAVVFPNVRELLYHHSIARIFFLAGGLVWLVGFAAMRWYGGRWPVRLWLAVPWTVLLLDVVGAALARRSVGLPLAIAADVGVIAAVVVISLRARWRNVHMVAAAAGVALALQNVYVLAASLHDLPDDLVVGADTGPAIQWRVPGSAAPGNVYHILLDNYLSESFAHSAGAYAATRFPGFTYYTRFNTNFPRTSSSELGLISGRFPNAGLSLKQWPQIALAQGFWKDLAGANVGLWIYPTVRWLCPADAVKCLASTDLQRGAGAAVTRDTIVDLWALRLMPASVRRMLNPDTKSPTVEAQQTVGFSVTNWFRSAFGLKQADGGSRAAVSALPFQYFNLKQFDELLADEASRPARGQYIYYHALIPHPLFIMNERCEFVKDPLYDADAYWGHVNCANLMVERLVAELERLGRLKDALIIVHADHGDMDFIAGPGWVGHGEFALDPGAREYQAPDATHYAGAFERVHLGDSAKWRSIAVEIFSSGLLLVKHPGATTYAEDTHPVQLLDIAPTVLSHFNIPANAYPGLPLRSVPYGREELFYAHSRDYDGKFSRYRLTTDGWRFVDDLPIAP